MFKFLPFFGFLSLTLFESGYASSLKEEDKREASSKETLARQKALDLKALLERFNKSGHRDRGENEFEPSGGQHTFWKEGKDVILLENN